MHLSELELVQKDRGPFWKASSRREDEVQGRLRTESKQMSCLSQCLLMLAEFLCPWDLQSVASQMKEEVCN